MYEETVTLKRRDVKALLAWALEARMKNEVLIAALPYGPAMAIQDLNRRYPEWAREVRK